MENIQIMTIIATASNAFVAAIVGFATYYNSKKMRESQSESASRFKEIEEKNLNLNMAQTELHIQELLVNARKLSLDILLEKYKLSTQNANQTEEQKAMVESLVSHSLQEILNSYEVACSKYLDNKIDKDRFKKTYTKEITDLFGNKSPYESLLSKTNAFHALKKVNEEWNNLEKN